jgi:hypothetical protein
METTTAGERDLHTAINDVRTRERKIMEFVRGSQFSIEGFKGIVE